MLTLALLRLLDSLKSKGFANFNCFEFWSLGDLDYISNFYFLVLDENVALMIFMAKDVRLLDTQMKLIIFNACYLVGLIKWVR